MYYYAFEFLDFEAGRLAAVRLSDEQAAPLRRDWGCVARDDRHALELATRAAAEEWPTPATRGRFDFIVSFASRELSERLRR